MSIACSAMPPGPGFVSSVTAFVDCQAQTLGSGAWTALSAPGSILTGALTGLLTIFIALIGYNLLLGRTLSVRDATLAFVKIGAVFALATSWPAYRTLVYDLVVEGPGQLVAQIGPQAGVAGSDGTLLQRLDLVDRGLTQLAILGPGRIDYAQYDQVPPAPFVGFDAFALGGSRILFLVTAIASLAAVRIVAGLMLALGPFFIAFLMFDATRSLFEGWVRVLGGAALASVGASVILGLELAFIEPWLSGVLARRMAGEPLPTVSSELFVLSLLFAILALAALYGCARVARAFRLPALVRVDSARSAALPWPTAATPAGRADRLQTPAEAERTRAAAMAGTIATIARRESALALSAAGNAPDRRASAPGPASNDPSRPGPMPLGRSFSRRSNARLSAGATKRDAVG